MLCTCYLCGSYAAMRSYAAMQLKHSRFMFAWCFCKGDRGGEGGGDDGRGGFEPTVGVSGCRAPMMAWKPFYPQETLLCERLKTTGEPFSLYSRVLGSGLHKIRTKAKKNGKGSLTVVARAPEQGRQFGKKWLIHVPAIRAYRRLSP